MMELLDGQLDGWTDELVDGEGKKNPGQTQSTGDDSKRQTRQTSRLKIVMISAGRARAKKGLQLCTGPSEHHLLDLVGLVDTWRRRGTCVVGRVPMGTAR